MHLDFSNNLQPRAQTCTCEKTADIWLSLLHIKFTSVTQCIINYVNSSIKK